MTGAHASLQCISCHANGYAGTPTDCYSCHEQDYNNSTNPDHVQAGFPTTCEDCHTTDAWSPSTWSHDVTGFPLTGAHASLPCISCHANGYAGTPTDCYSCHEQDYNNAPFHNQQGYPTNCELCHNTTSWATNWDHDQLYFPIYSGEHKGEWTVCADCHIGGDFTTFECIYCHAHSQQKMDQVHQGVPGYVYESWACYQCHPDGGGGIRPRWRKR